MSLTIAKDCTERLSAVALSVGLIIPRGKRVSGHVSERVFFFFFFFLRYATEIPWPRLRGRRLTGTRHGNVYRSVRKKQGIVVYQQRVLQTVASLRVVSLVLLGTSSWKSQILIPSKKPGFRYGKKLVHRESSGNGNPRSRSTPKRRLA